MLVYYLTIALQVFCIYHAYKNSSNYYWYFIIFFIPLIGCIVYLFTHVFNKKDVVNIAEEITTIINPSKKIKDLEKELAFSNTFQNKINLADAFLENRDYNNAILLYNKALEGNFKDEPYTLNKLINCYFETSKFEKVIEIANKINIDKDFKESVYLYGLALEQTGNFKDAEIQLKKVDIRFSNYDNRLELSKFLIRRNKKNEATEVLQEIISEINSMTKVNSRKYRSVFSEAEKILKEQ
ncbi:CDC27 family protein [uncultured Polaribacter sp.]|uniref:CDC27 family protein n=1 Tax=uncultured Polaribacter sp. TaxID=174711 RepID=UPI0026046416|nr:CDC27 family protein [uncultured Polaribacter sp.]